MLHRVAVGSVRGFVAEVAVQITGPPGAAEAAAPNGVGAEPPPDA
jgi:hypothetical protein